MFTALADALFRRTKPAPKWEPPHAMRGSFEERRHQDQEAAFRAHLMRHTHYR